MKVIIVGGVAGGATASARLRRLDENAEITIYEKTGYISYANCGMPYYIGGVVKEKDDLIIQTPESLYKRFNIKVKTNNEVINIDRKNKTVKVRDLNTGKDYEDTYDKLILATGSKQIVPDIKGLDNDKIFTLRNVEDAEKIYEHIKLNHPKKAIIVGGGFSGIEMAENLTAQGIETIILQKDKTLLPTLDKDFAEILQKYVRSKVALYLDVNVVEIKKVQDKLEVVCEDGLSEVADFVVMSVGTIPNSTLAKNAGLTLGIKDAVVTNDYMQTSDEDIYAVGDTVEITHFITKSKALIPMAGPANKQGRIVADNICGIKSTYKGTQGSSIMKVFDMAVASAGLTKTFADMAGYDADYVVLTSMSHATYYPGSKPMYIKVVFEKSNGKILGAQIIGQDGVDKRIDVLSTAIRAGMTAFDLEDLELSYSPPFSNAKDPVNMAGYAITNIITNKVKQIHFDELDLIEDIILLDTRSQVEYDNGHLENAINIPLDELRENLAKIPKGKKIYVYCHSGLRSYIACRVLSQNGYDCYNISGGYGYYIAQKER